MSKKKMLGISIGLVAISIFGADWVIDGLGRALASRFGELSEFYIATGIAMLLAVAAAIVQLWMVKKWRCRKT